MPFSNNTNVKYRKEIYLQVRNRKFIVDAEVARLGGIVEGVPCLLAGLVARGTY